MDATEATAEVVRARGGDDEAFRLLVERHKAYRQLGRFEARANFGTWLYRRVA